MRGVLENNIFEFGFMPGQTVADVGAGSGNYTLLLADVLGREGAVYAIDLSEDVLVRLKNLAVREGRDNIEVIIGDVEKSNGSNLRDDAVHGVVLANSLSQLEDRQACVREMYRITKRGGRAVVVDWLSESPFSRLSKKSSGTDIESVKRIFQSAGFRFERTWDAGEHHYGLIFRK